MHHDDSGLFSHNHPEHEFGEKFQEEPSHSRTRASEGSQQGNRLAYGLMLALVFLFPLFFIPFPGFPIGFTKALLFGVVGLLAATLIFFDMRREHSGIPVVYSVVVLGLFAAFVVSTLFSISPWVSIIGGNLASDTLVMIAAIVLVSIALPRIITTKKRAFFTLIALFGSGVLLFVFHLTRFFFGPSVLSFNIFGSIESTTAGSWPELSFFAGLFVVMATLLVQFMTLSREMKIAVWTVGALALLVVVATSFALAYLILAGAHLLITLYVITRSSETRISFARYALPLFLTALFAVCFFAVGAINEQIQERFGSAYTQVRPRWSATLEVAQGAWEDPRTLMVGSGPHTFSYLWEDHRPDEVIESRFWNTSFEEGVSTFATIAVTTGLLGLLALAGVAGYLIWRLAVFVRRPPEHPLMRALLAVSLGGSVYLMTVLLFTVVSPFVFVLAFFFLAFATSLEVQDSRLRLFGEGGGGHITPMLVGSAGVISLIVLLPFLSLVVARTLYASGSLALSVQGDEGITIEKVRTAEERLKLASRFEKNARYAQLLVDFKLARLRELLARLEAEEITPDEFKGEFNTLQSELVSSASMAVDVDPRNYVNWIKYGNVQEAFGALEIKGAFEEAQTAYTRAREENPTSPEIPLIKARLTALQEDVEGARATAKEALAMKSNYADAYLFLASLDLREDGVAAALETLDTAITAAPGNARLYYEKGLLHFSEEEYDEAANALGATVQLAPTSQNALYQYALSLYNGSGSNEEALNAMRQLAEVNPNNTVLADVIANMENGNDPFVGIEGVESPVGSTQEEAEEEGEEADELEGGSEVQEGPGANVDTEPTEEAEIPEETLQETESDL